MTPSGALRLWSLGLAAEIGLAAAGGLGIGAIGAAVAAGAEITLICSAAHADRPGRVP